ncbi:MAG: 6-carboxytetrahydropterin synthase QueD [Bacteroidia bacterium]
MRRVLVTKRFKFEAAHRLPTMPEGHKCTRIHGHNFKVDVNLLGEVNPADGMVRDFGEIKTLVNPLIEMLDHHFINEVGEVMDEPLLKVPTTENLVIWFYEKIKPTIPELYSVIIHETDQNSCEYREDF